MSQCEANSTVLQVRLTNPAPQRTNIATYQYRSDSPACSGLSPRRRPARRRPRAGRARGGCRRRAAAGARGSRFAGGAAPLSRLLASSPLIPAYPRASAVSPFRRSTISVSPFRVLILCLHPRRSFVHAVRSLLRAARAQASAEPTSVAPVCVSRTCCPSAARAAAAWTATDTAARSPAATRFRAAARPPAPSSTSAITKVRCPARGGRSAVSVGRPLFVQTSASHPFAGEREQSLSRTPRRIIVLVSVGATVHPSGRQHNLTPRVYETLVFTRCARSTLATKTGRSSAHTLIKNPWCITYSMVHWCSRL